MTVLPQSPIYVVTFMRCREGLIAVNYAARDKGITRHMRVAEAKAKCPELTLVHVETIGRNLTAIAVAKSTIVCRTTRLGGFPRPDSCVGSQINGAGAPAVQGALYPFRFQELQDVRYNAGGDGEGPGEGGSDDVTAASAAEAGPAAVGQGVPNRLTQKASLERYR